MCLAGAAFVGAAVADDGLDDDQRGLLAGFFGCRDRRVDGVYVVAVLDFERLPAVSAEAGGYILGEGHVRRAVEGDTVAVVEENQLAQTPVTRQRRRFRRNAFHQVAVADERVGVM